MTFLLVGSLTHAEAGTSKGAKASAPSESATLIRHKGETCVRATLSQREFQRDLTKHSSCTPGFYATRQAEPGHCVRSYKAGDVCTTGYKFNYKVLFHYDVNSYTGEVRQCMHVEGLSSDQEVEDCR